MSRQHHGDKNQPTGMWDILLARRPGFFNKYIIRIRTAGGVIYRLKETKNTQQQNALYNPCLDPSSSKQNNKENMRLDKTHEHSGY